MRLLVLFVMAAALAGSDFAAVDVDLQQVVTSRELHGPQLAVSAEELAIANDLLVESHGRGLKSDEQWHVVETDFDGDGSRDLLWMSDLGMHGNALGPYAVIRYVNGAPAPLGVIGAHHRLIARDLRVDGDPSRLRFTTYDRLCWWNGMTRIYVFDLKAGTIVLEQQGRTIAGEPPEECQHLARRLIDLGVMVDAMSASDLAVQLDEDENLVRDALLLLELRFPLRP